MLTTGGSSIPAFFGSERLSCPSDLGLSKIVAGAGLEMRSVTSAEYLGFWSQNNEEL